MYTGYLGYITKLFTMHIQKTDCEFKWKLDDSVWNVNYGQMDAIYYKAICVGKTFSKDDGKVKIYESFEKMAEFPEVLEE